ncbi:hypothetical protein pb186bvf_011890 [Paramecium bursaria]
MILKRYQDAIQMYFESTQVLLLKLKHINNKGKSLKNLQSMMKIFLLLIKLFN